MPKRRLTKADLILLRLDLIENKIDSITNEFHNVVPESVKKKVREYLPKIAALMSEIKINK